MPSVEKIIQKMKNQPNGIKLQEVEKVLKAYNYYKDRQRGSHIFYYNNNRKRIGIAIHGKDKLKRGYVENILQIIEEGEK